jgi:hypothetical protein
VSEITVARRFQGPPNSGNGGYSAGSFASAVGWVGPIEVTLRKPPPLDVPMQVEHDGSAAVLRWEDHVIASAATAELAEPPDAVPVSWEEARAAEPSYPGFDRHPFPDCFVCGVDRNPSEALALFPGRVGAGVVAAAWQVQPWAADHVELCWAALDCPSGWSIEVRGRPAVLGRMTAEVRRTPAAGERCIVVGRSLGREGRKAFADATLWGEDSTLLAHASTIWIEVDPASVQPPT